MFFPSCQLFSQQLPAECLTLHYRYSYSTLLFFFCIYAADMFVICYASMLIIQNEYVQCYMYRPLLHFLPPMPQVKICKFWPVSNHIYSTRPKKSITYTPIYLISCCFGFSLLPTSTHHIFSLYPKILKLCYALLIPCCY